MIEPFLQYSTNPIFLVVAIIVFAWLWEDGALIAGALLAADDFLPVPFALFAIFLGICSGDIGLYYFGMLARRWRGLRGRLLLNKKYRALSRGFRKKTLSNILIIRFIPGLRTAGFTLCGLWNLPFARFITAVVVAGLIWIALLFSVIYFLGTSYWLEGSPWKWGLAGIAVCLLFVNNWVAYFRK